MLNPKSSSVAKYIFYISHKRVTISFGNYFGSFGDGAGTELFLLMVVIISFGCNWGLCDLEDAPDERLSTGFPLRIERTGGKKKRCKTHIWEKAQSFKSWAYFHVRKQKTISNQTTKRKFKSMQLRIEPGVPGIIFKL